MNSDDIIPELHAETVGEDKVASSKPTIPKKKTKRRKTRKRAVEVPVGDANPFVARAEEVRRQLQDNRTNAVWLAILLGYYLVRAKAAVSHGEWSRQIKKHCPLSARTAQRYMALAERLFEQHLKNDSLSNLIIDPPPEIVACVKAEIGGRSLQELYVDFKVSKPRVRAKLLPEVTLLKQFVAMRQVIEEMKNDALGSEETVSSLEAKLKSCGDVVQEVFCLIRARSHE